MTNKPGLLPKWLVAHTAIKATYLLIVNNRNSIGFLNSIRSMKPSYVHIALLLSFARLMSLKRITKSRFYIMIAASFFAEGVFFIYGGIHGIYSKMRVLSEVFLDVFTLAWMVFLYPYYLVDVEDERKSQ
ncbi:hypothetical protein CWI42_020670 [Ordospora colligata]|uniref:Uncharacterized protein n=1 Tax=Ordospora colligata OC4 TaxID=1354746 RepID=A0A0B2UMG5_9MICR|nr:uncharacterized protein M896_020680 [Ordospora colligata OC4]KHN70232.1 hypothetical protein M896_020680 [Ordospora colligata OC4]TBU16776.1 hypothetical protein CWI41_020690 [Ordospora colligata]TBU17082.1 hypothetical protein CWI40_020690 [Ordospora colligata]TBU19325.1 hypothetical protein CWI42_020670 [Ordospora colligata]